MKSAAKIFYLIGFIFNVLALVIGILLLVLLAVSVNNAEIIARVVTQTGYGEQMVREMMFILIIFLSIALLFDIIAIILTLKARKDLIDNHGKLSTHIILLIGGVLTGNLFYLLRGIFGVSAASDDANE